MRILTLFFVFICTLNSVGQNIKLKKDVRIDTLNVSFSTSNKIEKNLKDALTKEFEKQIQNFNTEGHSYYLRLNPDSENSFLHMDLDSIKYVTNKFSTTTIGINLAIVTGQVLLISNLGWALPILPILAPGINGNLELKIDKELFISKREVQELGIGPSGFYMKKEKQNAKYLKSFGDSLARLYKKIDKQNRKR